MPTYTFRCSRQSRRHYICPKGPFGHEERPKGALASQSVAPKGPKDSEGRNILPQRGPKGRKADPPFLRSKTPKGLRCERSYILRRCSNPPEGGVAILSFGAFQTELSDSYVPFGQRAEPFRQLCGLKGQPLASSISEANLCRKHLKPFTASPSGNILRVVSPLGTSSSALPPSQRALRAIYCGTTTCSALPMRRIANAAIYYPRGARRGAKRTLLSCVARRRRARCKGPSGRSSCPKGNIYPKGGG